MEPYSLGIRVKSKDNAQSWQWADCERRANTSHATIYLSFLEINSTEAWSLWKTISIKISRKQSQTKEWVNSLPHLLTHPLKLHFLKSEDKRQISRICRLPFISTNTTLSHHRLLTRQLSSPPNSGSCAQSCPLTPKTKSDRAISLLQKTYRSSHCS